MESQVQQQEYIDTSSPEGIATSPAAPLANRPPAAQSDEQWRQIGAQISTILAQLPDYLIKFFNDYKQPLISVGLILAAFISVKVVLAVLDALNDIPLLAPTFELIGIGYSVWFVNRYLLRASNRQELSQEFEALKKQVVGNEQLPES